MCIRDSYTRALFVQSTESNNRHTQHLHEIASFFIFVVGFVAPQVVSIYAREVRSSLYESGHLQQNDQVDALLARGWFRRFDRMDERCSLKKRDNTTRRIWFALLENLIETGENNTGFQRPLRNSFASRYNIMLMGETCCANARPSSSARTSVRMKRKTNI